MLYIVATPIGNLEDVTLRALRVLREADLILCEDTRVTKRLLAKYEINTPTMSYHQHSGVFKIDKIIAELNEGKNIALATDAGTPGIADPGNKLIAQIVETRQSLPTLPTGQAGGQAGNVSTDGNPPAVQIIPVPGPSAVIAALSACGLPTDEFLFLGFLPHKKGRQTMVREIVASERTVVAYESCHRITKLLRELIDNGGNDLKLVVCRELTKMFESVYRGTPAEVLAVLEQDKHNLKGEFVVVAGR